MKSIKLLLAVIFTISLLNGCSFITNSFKYKDITENFVNDVLAKDYDKALTLMATDNKVFANTNLDTLKFKLSRFNDMLSKNFGNKLDYAFISSQKKVSSVAGQSTPPNTTVSIIQFSNGKEFGELQVLFDDKTNKILYIEPVDIKAPIPNMLPFWFFGILPISVLIFNIYAIVKVKKSGVKQKWLKYIAIIIFNIPSIGYNAMSGIFFNLLSIQIMLGVSFAKMGFANSAWIFGIPLGAIFVLWKLHRNNFGPAIDDQIINHTEIDNIENNKED